MHILKAGGGKRPLGIPAIRDRVAQQACRLVIEPIFEASFLESSYGFRPKRSAHGALSEVKLGLVRGEWVVDADIQGFFDNLDHELLMGLVALNQVVAHHAFLQGLPILPLLPGTARFQE